VRHGEAADHELVGWPGTSLA